MTRAFLVLFAAVPLWADVVSVSGSVSGTILDSHYPGAALGVDMLASRLTDGSTVIHDFLTQWSSSGNWAGWGNSLYVSIPAYQSATATFTVSDPLTYNGSFPSNLSFTIASDSTTTDVSLSAFCDDSGQWVFPNGGYGMNLTFTPCGSDLTIYPWISGNAWVRLAGWQIPEEPGQYFNSFYLWQSIDYTLTVNYIPLVPEPGLGPPLLVLALACGVVVWRRKRRAAALTS